MVSDVTLPSGPPGSDRLASIQRHAAWRRSQQDAQDAAQAPLLGGAADEAATGAAGQRLSSKDRAFGAAYTGAPVTGCGSNATNGACGPPGISPPLLPNLLRRFPFVRRLGLHRSSLQHPAFEAAALQNVAACHPNLTQLCLYDTLAWDFPQQLPNLTVLSQLVTLKLWGLGAPGLDPSAQWAYSRGLMSLSSLTRLQELTLRWLFGRQEVVWTCPYTPRLIRALTDGGALLRALDLNAFMLDRPAAASLARVSSLRSLSLYFDAEGSGWQEVVSLMALPELTRLVLSYEGDALAGPWAGDGPPAVDEPQPQAPQGPGPGPAGALGLGLGHAGAHQPINHPNELVGAAVPDPNHHFHHHQHHHGNNQHQHPNEHQHQQQPNNQAGPAVAAAAAAALAQLAHGRSSTRSASPAAPSRRRLPSWAQRPFSLQYLSLTTSPALYRLLGRLDTLLPHLTYLSVSSVGEFGPGQRELEGGLMAMAAAGSQLARIKLFCMELRPELLVCLTALPHLQELMLFNVWVAVDTGQQQQQQQQPQQQPPPQQQQQPQQPGAGQGLPVLDPPIVFHVPPLPLHLLQQVELVPDQAQEAAGPAALDADVAPEPPLEPGAQGQPQEGPTGQLQDPRLSEPQGLPQETQAEGSGRPGVAAKEGGRAAEQGAPGPSTAAGPGTAAAGGAGPASGEAGPSVGGGAAAAAAERQGDPGPSSGGDRADAMDAEPGAEHSAAPLEQEGGSRGALHHQDLGGLRHGGTEKKESSGAAGGGQSRASPRAGSPGTAGGAATAGAGAASGAAEQRTRPAEPSSGPQGAAGEPSGGSATAPGVRSPDEAVAGATQQPDGVDAGGPGSPLLEPTDLTDPMDTDGPWDEAAAAAASGGPADASDLPQGAGAQAGVEAEPAAAEAGVRASGAAAAQPAVPALVGAALGGPADFLDAELQMEIQLQNAALVALQQQVLGLQQAGPPPALQLHGQQIMAHLAEMQQLQEQIQVQMQEILQMMPAAAAAAAAGAGAAGAGEGEVGGAEPDPVAAAIGAALAAAAEEAAGAGAEGPPGQGPHPNHPDDPQQQGQGQQPQQPLDGPAGGVIDGDGEADLDDVEFGNGGGVGGGGGGGGGGNPVEGALLRNATRATALAESLLEPLAQLSGRLKQLLIEFGPEGNTCFITQGLVRSLEPLAPGLRSLHLLSWNMEGLMLTHLEPLCFTAFTELRSLTVANRISPDSQVNFAPPLPETSGHVIYLGQLPRTLHSLCANRVNVVAGLPPAAPQQPREPPVKQAAPAGPAALSLDKAGGAAPAPPNAPISPESTHPNGLLPASSTAGTGPVLPPASRASGSGADTGAAGGGTGVGASGSGSGAGPSSGPAAEALGQTGTNDGALGGSDEFHAQDPAGISDTDLVAAPDGPAQASTSEGTGPKMQAEGSGDQDEQAERAGPPEDPEAVSWAAPGAILLRAVGASISKTKALKAQMTAGSGGGFVPAAADAGAADTMLASAEAKLAGAQAGLSELVAKDATAARALQALGAAVGAVSRREPTDGGTDPPGSSGGGGRPGMGPGQGRAPGSRATPPQVLVSAPLQHLWLADCNVRGAAPEELAEALPALQTLVVRHVSKQEDLPPQLLTALSGLKDLTTLGLGGFQHRLVGHLSGLTQLRHLMLDPRRFEDIELDPEMVLDPAAAEGDRSLALHESVLALAAGGLQRLRSVWLPDWAVPPHQLVQWQLQMAQVAPLVALRLVDHHYFWRLPAPVGCPEVQDRLQWWGFDAWNVL